jgi:hypothetical protein
MGYVTAEWLPEQALNLLQNQHGNGCRRNSYAPLVEMALPTPREGGFGTRSCPSRSGSQRNERNDSLRGRTTTTLVIATTTAILTQFSTVFALATWTTRSGRRKPRDVLTKYTF